jgi:adenine phosphoribosyltransferase
MNIDRIKNNIRNVPNFPKPGIDFKDITPILRDPLLFNTVIDIFVEHYKSDKIDVVVGIESRGFIFAAPIALKLGCGLAIARKPGKLPYETVSANYSLEYGIDALELHIDSINPGDRVLILDDLLATGGTVAASIELVKMLKGKLISCAFMIELLALNGSKLFHPINHFSIIKI